MLAFPPLDAAVGIAATTVSALTAIAGPIAGVNATAAGIVGVTILIRLLLSPLSYLQVRAERRRAALAPRLKELQRRYRHDRARLNAETLALYRTEKANPLGGCLPALLQAPFFLVMYRLATHPPAGAGLLEEPLFGVALGHHLLDGLTGAAGPVFGVLFLALAAVAFGLSRRHRRAAAAGAAAANEDGGPAATLARLLPLLPYTTLVVAAVVPLAAGLYLVTTTAWTYLEHLVWRRPARVTL